MSFIKTIKKARECAFMKAVVKCLTIKEKKISRFKNKFTYNKVQNNGLFCTLLYMNLFDII